MFTLDIKLNPLLFVCMYSPLARQKKLKMLIDSGKNLGNKIVRVLTPITQTKTLKCIYSASLPTQIKVTKVILFQFKNLCNLGIEKSIL